MKSTVKLVFLFDCLIDYLLDMSSLIWLKAIYLQTQNYIKHVNDLLSVNQYVIQVHANHNHE